MAEQGVQRRLAAILAADVAGYTRLMEEDTDGTVAAWQAAREEVIKPSVANHSGKIVKLTGDGFLVEFATVQDAVKCAIGMQSGLAASSLDFRMGVSLGDIVDDGEDIHGEGVNVAARLEGLAEPGGICISGDVHNQVRNRIEAKFDDMGERDVKNVSAPVRVFAIRSETEEAAPSSLLSASLDKPSIAVLPFDNLSGDPEQEYFSDGVAEDIITALSHFSWFFVIARNSSFSFKGENVPVKKVAEELGVRYLLEGSVRRAGDRIRVTAQLIDAETDQHIWADRYDRDLDDIFAVQDEITESVAREVAPELLAAEMRQARRRATPSLDTWSRVMRAHSLIANMTPEDNAVVIDLLRDAIAADPRSSMAHADLGAAQLWAGIYGWQPDTSAAYEAALESAGTAVELDSRDSRARTILGWTEMFSRKHEEAIHELELAIDNNPNLAFAYSVLSGAHAFSGNSEMALKKAAIAIQLSPRDPLLGLMYGFQGLAYFAHGDYETAVDWFNKSVQHRPPFTITYRLIAASLGKLGRIEEATAATQKFLAFAPGVTIEATLRRMPWKLPEHQQTLIDGLRAAGMPEGD
jgi:adenylate cyclase